MTTVSRPTKEYLATLDDAAFGAASGVQFPEVRVAVRSRYTVDGGGPGRTCIVCPFPMHGRITGRAANEDRPVLWLPDENFEMHPILFVASTAADRWANGVALAAVFVKMLWGGRRTSGAVQLECPISQSFTRAAGGNSGRLCAVC